MPKQRVSASPNSPSFQELWDVLGSKLMDAARGSLSSKQVVAGSSPVSRSSFKKSAF
jgi:maltose-binding protein MalE